MDLDKNALDRYITGNYGENQFSQEPEEPEPEDYVIYDSVRWYAVGQVEGEFLGYYKDRDTAEQSIRDHMKTHQFWPNVWLVSDHGNLTLLTFDQD